MDDLHPSLQTKDFVCERINLSIGRTWGVIVQHSAIYRLFLLAVVASTAAADDTPPFKITTERDNDRVDVTAEKDQVVFAVHSPSGIGNAVIERKSEKWPDAVVLHLHLAGLESLQVVNGKITLNAAVSSPHGQVRLWKDSTEDPPLDRKSPYWTNVRLVGGDGKPARSIPLKEGYFEIRLPRAFFHSDPQSITVGWIDFFRN